MIELLKLLQNTAECKSSSHPRPMAILCEWQQQVERLDLRNEGVYISAQAISNFCKDQFVIPCVHKAESLMGLLIYLGKRQARKQQL